MDVSVKIDSLSYGGCGVGRISGKVVFVPYSAPGDNVRVGITRETRGFAEGDIVEFISKSPLRREPPCPLHSICGGCQWLHVPYKEQLKAKEEIFRDTLRKIGKIDPSIVLPAQPSPLELNYRSRVQFKVSKNRIGFYKRVSHELVEVPECPLAHPLINRILKGLRHMIPSPAPITRIDINISSSDGNGMVGMYLSEGSGFDLDLFFRRLADSVPEVAGLVLHTGKKVRISGTSYLFSQEGEYRFRASEGSFSQVNYMQNISMRDYILSLADLKGDEAVLELYSGGGNFTIPLASRAGKVIGIEVGSSSVSDARENARTNGVNNAAFIQATAEKGIEGVRSSGLGAARGRVDLVVIDPPRDGCSSEVVKGIASFKPRKIIYISCNPSTLARDLGRFQSMGYASRSSRPFDMFPQTYHIESVTELVPL